MPPELAFSFEGWQLVGTSVAARATAFAIPELGVAVDAGRLTPTVAAQPHLLVTHAHLDHTAGLLAYLNLRARLYNREPTRVWVPASMHRELVSALGLFPGMASVRKKMALEEVIFPAEDGQEISFPWGTARAFSVRHSVDTLGWALVRKGESEAFVVFAGDGDPRLFRKRPELLAAQVAVVECSFVEENRRVAARLSAHAHVLDWVELAPELRCQVLVLSHLPEDTLADGVLGRVAAAFPGRLVVWRAP